MFDSLFGIEKGSDKGEIGISETNISVIPEQLQINEGKESALVVQVRDNDGTPIPKIGISFGIVDTEKIKALGIPNKETDANGISVIRIEGIKKGETDVMITAKFDSKTAHASAHVSVEAQDKSATT